jgi:hypothetical protein
MEICIAKFDETEDWLDEELKRVSGRILTVYLYNPKHWVHLCEFTPSHELHFVGFVMEGSEAFGALDDGAREVVFEKLRAGLLDQPEISYVHVSDVERLPQLEHDQEPQPGRGVLGQFKVDDESDEPHKWTEEQMGGALEAAREYVCGNGYVDT